MVSKSMPVVWLHGSPFERGRQHALRFRERIVNAIGNRRGAVGAEAWQHQRAAAGRSITLLSKIDPALREEVDGLAQGVGCDAIDVLLYSGFEFFDEAPPTGCSAVARVDRNGRATVAQNWDADAGADGDLAVFVHSGRDGFELAVVATIGMLGWVGQNRHGLALVNNDVMLDRRLEGLPSQAVRRIALGAANVPQALIRLQSLPHMGGRAYLLGDETGAIAGVEVSPTGGVHRFHGQILSHTNHALTDLSALEDRAMLQQVYPSSSDRLARLQGLLAGDDLDMRDVLSDKGGAPNAICKSRSATEPTETAFSVVFRCHERLVSVCRGRPGENTFQDLMLDQPFRIAG